MRRPPVDRLDNNRSHLGGHKLEKMDGCPNRDDRTSPDPDPDPDPGARLGWVVRRRAGQIGEPEHDDGVARCDAGVDRDRASEAGRRRPGRQA